MEEKEEILDSNDKTEQLDIKNNNIVHMVEKKNKFPWILVVIIVVLILVGGYFAYCTFTETNYIKDLYNKLVEKNKQSDIVDPATDVVNPTTPEDENSYKVEATGLSYDANKEVIYSINYIDYKINLSKDQTVLHNDWGPTYNLSNYKVPFINLNSSDAAKANEEIKNIYTYFVGLFDKNSGYYDSLNSIEQFDYSYYLDDNVLSVIMTSFISATGATSTDYYTYNFSLSTGKLLSYKETYEYAGISESNISSLALNAINTNFKQAWIHGFGEISDTNIYEESLTSTKDTFTSSIGDGTVKYYITEGKKFGIVVTFNLYEDIRYFDYKMLVN